MSCEEIRERWAECGDETDGVSESPWIPVAGNTGMSAVDDATGDGVAWVYSDADLAAIAAAPADIAYLLAEVERLRSWRDALADVVVKLQRIEVPAQCLVADAAETIIPTHIRKSLTRLEVACAEYAEADGGYTEQEASK